MCNSVFDSVYDSVYDSVCNISHGSVCNSVWNIAYDIVCNSVNDSVLTVCMYNRTILASFLLSKFDGFWRIVSPL